MIRFVVKRLLYLFPTVLAVGVVLFLFDQHSLQNQIESRINNEIQREYNQESLNNLFEDEAHRKNWDQPPFYLSLRPSGWSPEIFNFVLPRERTRLVELSKLANNFEETVRLNQIWNDAEQTVDGRQELNSMLRSSTVRQSILILLKSGDKNIQSKNIRQLINELKNARSHYSLNSAIPKCHWHGSKNRFHNFFFNKYFSGSLKSIVDGRPAYDKVWRAAGVTLLINIIALVLVVLIGVRLGGVIYRWTSSRKGQITRIFLYVLYAVPLFWIAATILILASENTYWFDLGAPSLMSGEYPSVLTFLRPRNVPFVLLPIITIVISVLSVVAIHMYRGLTETGSSKFILSARMRGLKENLILSQHNKPVAIFTIVTLVGNSIPGLLSGSIVIEMIFNVPGMGRLLYQSLYAYDWNVVIPILLIGLIFSVVGQLLTDIYYTKKHPTIQSEA